MNHDPRLDSHLNFEDTRPALFCLPRGEAWEPLHRQGHQVAANDPRPAPITPEELMQAPPVLTLEQLPAELWDGMPFEPTWARRHLPLTLLACSVLTVLLLYATVWVLADELVPQWQAALNDPQSAQGLPDAKNQASPAQPAWREASRAALQSQE
jgi:hypothetical protein